MGALSIFLVVDEWMIYSWESVNEKKVSMSFVDYALKYTDKATLFDFQGYGLIKRVWAVFQWIL